MTSYQIPRRAEETVYCRQYEQPEECRVSPEVWNHHIAGKGDNSVTIVGKDELAVTVSENGEMESVMAKRDASSLSSIESGEVLSISAHVKTIMKLHKAMQDYSPIVNFLEKAEISMEDSVSL